MSVNIVVVGHNNHDKTKNCLDCIERSMFIRPTTILVDNFSTPAYTLHGAVRKIVRTKENLPFVLAANLGVRESKHGEYLMLLNNDCYINPYYINTLIGFMREHPDAAVVSGKLLYPNGTVQNVGSVMDFDTCALSERFKHVHGNDPIVNNLETVQVVSFAAAIIRRSVWDELGGMTEEFAPGGHDDADFCLRARQKGYHIWYNPNAVAIHEEHGTFGRNQQAFQDYVMATVTKSNPLFHEKWHGKAEHIPL